MSITFNTDMNIYSLYDNTSLTYEGLYLFPNKEAAIRGFRHSISQIPFPEDKDIVFFGSFDTKQGLIFYDESEVITVAPLIPEVVDDK